MTWKIIHIPSFTLRGFLPIAQDAYIYDKSSKRGTNPNSIGFARYNGMFLTFMELMNKREILRFNTKSKEGKQLVLVSYEVTLSGKYDAEDKILSEPWYETEGGLRVKKLTASSYEIVATSQILLRS